ncbi:MAG: hypothetical protein HYZ89_00295 [Candidatus Omnitrophica bacterium]|nr:hypothetical protein [Candidatus Omnitrophota bacterium]
MRNQRGQTTAEYAIVLGVVLAALVGMQIYVKRGAQARVKLGVDELVKAGTVNLTWLPATLPSGPDDVQLITPTGGPTADGQYEPYYAESKYRVSRTSPVVEDVNLAGTTVTRTIDSTEKEETKRASTGYQEQHKWQGEAD